MNYIDGFVLAVPKKKVKAYKALAEKACKIWMEHGALEYVECVGEDLKSKWGIPFPKIAKAKPTETVAFAYIVYKSRAHRDSVNKKVMADPRMNCGAPADMPFDMKRMTYGGFNMIVSKRK